MEEAQRLSTGRFGYADNIAILAFKPFLVLCEHKFQEKLDSTISWVLSNGIFYQLQKTELQYFHRKRGSPLEPAHKSEGRT